MITLDDLQSFVNRTGFAWRNLIGQDQQGSFLPVLSYNGDSTNVAYSTRSGTYTKIGRVVHIHVSIELSNKGTGTGDVLVTGMPYAAYEVNSPTSAVRWHGLTSSLISCLAMYVGTSTVALLANTAAATTHNTTLKDTDLANTSRFYFNMTYLATDT